MNTIQELVDKNLCAELHEKFMEDIVRLGNQNRLSQVKSSISSAVNASFSWAYCEHGNYWRAIYLKLIGGDDR